MRLVDFFIPFLASVRQFQLVPEGDEKSIETKFNILLNDARAHALEAGFRATDIDAALFAVVAWADEMLLGADWGGAAQWQRYLLQKRYFNISNAGVVFFARLESLSGAQQQVREVYVICLCMGFSGRYGYARDQKALADIRQASLASLLQDNAALSLDARQRLFPECYSVDFSPSEKRPIKRLGGMFPLFRALSSFSSFSYAVLLIPLSILLTLYGIYHVIIQQLATTLLQQIIL